MRKASFVVFEIALQDAAQPGLMEDNDVVQALAPNGTDETLNVGILPRALRCSQDFVNAHPSSCLTKLLSIDCVAVAQQVPRGIVPRECFQKLSSSPFACLVSGHSEMHRTSPIMAKNHEGEQELKSDGRHDEEVYGDQVLGVVFEKGSPRLGGRFPVPDHVLGDGCL